MIHQYRNAILKIAKENGAYNIRVFGSSARGELSPESDIDILLDLEPGRDLFDLVTIKQDLEAVTGRKIDVVTEKSLSKYLRSTILQEAQSL